MRKYLILAMILMLTACSNEAASSEMEKSSMTQPSSGVIDSPIHSISEGEIPTVSEFYSVESMTDPKMAEYRSEVIDSINAITNEMLPAVIVEEVVQLIRKTDPEKLSTVNAEIFFNDDLVIYGFDEKDYKNADIVITIVDKGLDRSIWQDVLENFLKDNLYLELRAREIEVLFVNEAGELLYGYGLNPFIDGTADYNATPSLSEGTLTEITEYRAVQTIFNEIEAVNAAYFSGDDKVYPPSNVSLISTSVNLESGEFLVELDIFEYDISKTEQENLQLFEDVFLKIKEKLVSENSDFIAREQIKTITFSATALSYGSSPIVASFSL